MWYEIFINVDGLGTRTIEVCQSLTEATKRRKKYIKSGVYSAEELHIDKWKNLNTPEKVKTIV